MTPAEALLTLAARFADLPALPPGSPDAFTQRQAPVLLSRLAAKIASDDPIVAGVGREQLLAIAASWRDRASPGAGLWAGACAAIGEAMPEPVAAPVERGAGQDAIVLMLAAAYERGRAMGRKEAGAEIEKLRTQLAAAPSGLRVAALLAAVDNAVSNTRTATDDYLTGTRDAYVTAARLIRAHLGEPTPAERMAAEVLTAGRLRVAIGEVHKGSLVEVGAALHAGVPVFWVGPEYSTAPRHRNVRRVATLDEAIVIAQSVEGDPTPEGRGVADDGPPEPIVADVLPGEYEAAGAAVAMMRDPKVVAVVTEVLALAPALADISGGPGTVDEAWQDIGREMQEPCGRNGLLTIAMLAIHGALAYDAAGLPTAGSSIARRVAEGELRGEEFHEQADALAPGDGGKAGGVPCPVHANGADGLNCDVCIRASTERAAKGGA